MDEEMDKFEQDIGMIGLSNNDDNSSNEIKLHGYNLHKSSLDVVSKEIDSLLQNRHQRTSTFISKIKTKYLVNKSTEVLNKVHVAIAAAGCASSSSKIIIPLCNNNTREKQFYRKGGGKVWYDPTMKQWPNHDFRLFVGNLGREVNDHSLSVPFMQYSSFIKAHVVKNRRTSMSRGCYGFVSFGNSADYLRAIKELNGKYVGSRPMKIEKSNWKKRCLDNK
ncbi:RNA recognition motif domain [Cinara cedri]|uniref:RNA recognition motif domain n=1 Tax=Cinara cedri TaxID=506608 RepID=A0A5E4NMU4_9HEMI|nr:RNA recognition motif domain [Cinara cedri]